MVLGAVSYFRSTSYCLCYMEFTVFTFRFSLILFIAALFFFNYFVFGSHLLRWQEFFSSFLFVMNHFITGSLQTEPTGARNRRFSATEPSICFNIVAIKARPHYSCLCSCDSLCSRVMWTIWPVTRQAIRAARATGSWGSACCQYIKRG
jgi:hypothetical protein